ncbi:tRNA dihydrouridine synthase DusB [Thiospirochaeta perfilievii]|uniref:tRNA-dihydrouridine synthase n=1 Tax=Thiospirochaeta perfilievii TaxID=252967 RepID=A0A5C1QBN0_9SPIO|nr:tRNA dihydrouridine synthase DusB [Thiospirochaeta perfilievii]
MQKIKVKDLELEGNIFLAPTAGYSDRPFRQICTDFGSVLNFSEMVSCEAIIRDNPKTLQLMEPANNEKHTAIQIFTGNPDSAAKSIKSVLKFNPSIIDLNCGCPVPKILKSGSGSDLMKTPKKINEIVRAICNETDIPVSIKIRSGFTHESINFLECANEGILGGASMVSLHPRTRSQGYSGFANWDYIKELKSMVDVPVIGSGDLYTPYDAKRMLEETNCDGVMFARGIFGNPFLFAQTIELLTTGEIKTQPTLTDKMEIAFKHLKLSVEFYGEDVALKEIKKHLCSYTKGFPGAKETRDKLVRCSTLEEYETVFQSLL